MVSASFLQICLVDCKLDSVLSNLFSISLTGPAWLATTRMIRLVNSLTISTKPLGTKYFQRAFFKDCTQ